MVQIRAKVEASQLESISDAAKNDDDHEEEEAQEKQKMHKSWENKTNWVNSTREAS